MIDEADDSYDHSLPRTRLIQAGKCVDAYYGKTLDILARRLPTLKTRPKAKLGHLPNEAGDSNDHSLLRTRLDHAAKCVGKYLYGKNINKT